MVTDFFFNCLICVFEEVSYPYQDCIYLIKKSKNSNIVK